MLKLLSRLTVLLLLVIITHIILLISLPEGDNLLVFLAELERKEERLVNVDAPSLIFVGGSSLSYGIDGESIEDEFDYTVINMGLHAGFQLAFMLEQVRDDTDSDDIVILGLEYVIYSEELNHELLRQLFSVDERLVLEHLSTLQEIEGIITIHPAVTRRALFDILLNDVQQSDCSVGVRECANAAFDEYGSVSVDSMIATETVILPNDPIVGEDWRVAGNILDLLDSFVRDMREQGTDVYIIFPPVPEPMFDLVEGRLDNLPTTIQNRVDVTILGTPRDYVLPIQYFLNTEYHVNLEGRQLHTDRIIEQLRGVLQP